MKRQGLDVGNQAGGKGADHAADGSGAAAATGRETEIKLAIGTQGVAAADDYFRNADTRVVESTYFDTEDLDLRRAGIDLRVRRDGNRLIQTIKFSSSAGSPLTRHEHETELSTPDPDQAHLHNVLPADLRASIADRVLKAQFMTRFDRRRRFVPEVHPIVEAVYDRGTIEAGDHSMPISEVEFELLGNGDMAGLVDVCLAFLDRVPASIAIESKSARGFRLAADGAPDVTYGKTRAIPGDALLPDAIRDLFRDALRHFLGNIPAVAEHSPPASIHQMRVGLRRLRSAVSAFRPVLDLGDDEALMGETKDLFAALGVIRDRDVLVSATLPGIGDDVLDRKLRRAITREAGRQRGEAVRQLQQRMTGSEFCRFVLDLIAWIESDRWLRAGRPVDRLLRRRTVGEFAAVRLGQLHDRLVKMAGKARRSDKKAWHAARIAAKKLRYAAEPLLSALDLPTEASRTYAQSLKRLQETLGELNDVETARVLLQGFLVGIDGHGKARSAARKALKHWEKRRSEETLLAAAQEFRGFEQAGFPGRAS